MEQLKEFLFRSETRYGLLFHGFLAEVIEEVVRNKRQRKMKI